MLAREEFDILVAFEEAARTSCDEDAVRLSGESFEAAAPDTMEVLRDRHLIRDVAITDEGLEALEPYRAKRAVLFAAGFGSRMVPITINTPKPLVRVHGRRIIDTLLDALDAVGIDEVYLVRGYLAEQFDQLLYDYPGLHLIDNPLYDTTNNISSAVAAREHFECAYAFESDLLLREPHLITRYQYASNYLGVPVNHTDDWCFTVRDGIIRDLRKGGDDCHHMFGISYWNAGDGRKLAVDLPAVFARDDGRDIFWDDVPIVRCPEDYEVRIRECTFDDVAEIDSFTDLQALDPAYRI